MKKRLVVYTFLAISWVSVYAQDFTRVKVKNSGGEALAYSPDGQLLAVNSVASLNIFNAATGLPLKSFPFEGSKIISIDFDAKSELVAASFQDGRVLIWKFENGVVVGVIPEKSAVRGVRFISDDRIVLLTDKIIRVHDYVNNKTIWSKPHSAKDSRGFAVSPDFIAFGGSTGIIYLMDPKDGRDIAQLARHNDWIRSIDINPKQTILASGSDNGEVFLWDLSTRQRINTFTDVIGRIYGLKFSPDGNALAYAGNTLKMYSFEKKYSIFEFGKIEPVLAMAFAPDGQTMSIVEDLAPYWRMLDITSLNLRPSITVTDSKDQTPPQIFISSPPNIREDRVRVAADILPVKGSIFDEAGIQSLKVNGIETPIKNRSNFVINIPLSMGENYISIEAKDVNGNIALRKFLVDRKEMDGSDYNPENARNFLFVVGINDYKHMTPLKNAVKDVSDVTRLLMSKYNFDFENVILLKNDQATRANIIEGLRSLIEKLTPQDNLVIYFAGHGYFDKLMNEGYWVPVEANNTITDYIPNSIILKILDNINTQHTFLVADACFSGALFASTNRGYVENVERFRSRWGLTSGRLEVVSDGNQGSNSPFARHFMDFLNKNSDRNFAVSELVQYVKIKTAEESDQTPLGNPIKSLGDEGGEFIFYPRKD